MSKNEVVEEHDVPIVRKKVIVRKNGTKRVVTLAGKSMTQQSDHDRCCIHNVIERYKRTGLLPQRTVAPIDPEKHIPDGITYHEAMNTLVAAQDAFDALPSDLRERFDEDPQKYCEFVNDPENKEEMEKLGLLEIEAPPEVLNVNVVSDATKTNEGTQQGSEGEGEAK
jgi:phage internal scaffolding protein